LDDCPTYPDDRPPKPDDRPLRVFARPDNPDDPPAHTPDHPHHPADPRAQARVGEHLHRGFERHPAMLERNELSGTGPGRQGPLEVGDQWRESQFDRVPENIEIDSVVAMNKPIPHRADPSPLDRCKSSLRLFAHLGGSLANDFYRLDDRKETKLVARNGSA